MPFPINIIEKTSILYHVEQWITIGSSLALPNDGLFLQEELAEAMEVSRQTIGSLENGRYNPSILLAFKLARYFGMRIEDIFIYEEEKNEKTR